MGFKLRRLKPPRSVSAILNHALAPVQNAIDRNPTLAAAAATVALPVVLGSVIGVGANLSAATAAGVTGESLALDNPNVAKKTVDALPYTLGAAGLAAGPAAAAVASQLGSTVKGVYDVKTAPVPAAGGMVPVASPATTPSTPPPEPLKIAALAALALLL